MHIVCLAWKGGIYSCPHKLWTLMMSGMNNNESQTPPQLHEKSIVLKRNEIYTLRGTEATEVDKSFNVKGKLSGMNNWL